MKKQEKEQEMKAKAMCVTAWGVLLLMVSAVSVPGTAKDLAGKPPGGVALRGTVTLTGNLLCSTHVLGMVPAADKEHSVFMIAFDGVPAVKAEFDQIVNDYWPKGGSLSGDGARELENQFMQRLKYNLDGPKMEAMWKEVCQHAYVTAVSVTGEARTDAEGRRWISVTAYGPARFRYPDKMMAPYKPLVMPAKPPLDLKLSNAVSMRCIYVAPGKFYMGCPLYQIPHWEEGPQHMVTLTKGYYLAETPVTYEQYAAVTGDVAAGAGKDPQSAAGLSCQMFANFCKILAAKTRRTVRPPSSAEWEYAARVGVSNPSFPSNDPPVERNYAAKVTATRPNAWGFYQMKVGKSSERTSDAQGPSANEHREMVDPRYPVKQDSMDPIPEGGPPNGHCAKGSDDYPIQEMMRTGCGRGVPFQEEWNNMAKRERVLVEDAPTTPKGK